MPPRQSGDRGPRDNRFEGAGRGYQQPQRRAPEPAQQSAMASAFAKLQQAKGALKARRAFRSPLPGWRGHNRRNHHRRAPEPWS